MINLYNNKKNSFKSTHFEKVMVSLIIVLFHKFQICGFCPFCFSMYFIFLPVNFFIGLNLPLQRTYCIRAQEVLQRI